MISKKTIDDVIASAHVDEVISDFMTLKRKGANYEGLCPFHNEKTPSFKVNPTKGIYKCFGCGKAGGSVQFVMDHEGMSFADTIKFLAKKYGIEIVEDKREESKEYDELVKKRESLQAAVNFAQEFFKEQLFAQENVISGLAYLKERGFTKETIEKFGLGFAPEGFDNFTKKAFASGFQQQMLLDAGLIKTNDRGNVYDFFRHRVMFPFYNVAGKIVAFGGRVLGKADKGPKYLNSPETELYIKSKILYGIFQSKNAIKKEDTCILVEGYTDVISLHQAGIENVVASSGTSLTEEQARLIARFSQNVTILYDGDPAGIKASLRGIDILLNQGLNVRVVLLDEGEDPDSFARKHNQEEIRAYFKAQTKDFILFKSDLLYADAGNDPIKKAEANAEVIRSIAIVPDPLKRAQYIHEFSKISGLNDNVIQAEAIKSRSRETAKEIKDLHEEIALIQSQEIQHDSRQANRYSTVEQERAVAEKLIRYANLEYKSELTVAMFVVQTLSEDTIDFQDPIAKQIITFTNHKLEADEMIDFNEFIFSAQGDLATFIADALEDKYKLSQAWEKNEIYIPTDRENYKMDVFSSVLLLKVSRLRVLLERYLNKLQSAENEEAKKLILLEFAQLRDIRDNLSQNLGAVVIG